MALKVAEGRPEMPGQALEVHHLLTGFGQLREDRRLGRPGVAPHPNEGPGPPHEFRQGLLVGLVSSLEEHDRKARRPEQPTQGTTAHATPPAVEMDGSAVRSLGEQPLCLTHEPGHLGSDQLESPLDSRFPAHLLVQGAHLGTLGVIKQGEGLGSGDVGLGEFGRRAGIQEKCTGFPCPFEEFPGFHLSLRHGHGHEGRLLRPGPCSFWHGD